MSSDHSIGPVDFSGSACWDKGGSKDDRDNEPKTARNNSERDQENQHEWEDISMAELLKFTTGTRAIGCVSAIAIICATAANAAELNLMMSNQSKMIDLIFLHDQYVDQHNHHHAS